MAQIFISYSKQNVEFARYLRGALQEAGFDVWMDEVRLSTSARWADTIEASISAASAFVVIMSPEAKESKWVARELLLAQRLRKPIFPILYSGEVWWNLADIQYEDMRAGLQAALSPRVIAVLRRTVDGAPTDDISSPLPTAHNPPAPPPQTDSRRLEAAMPAETRAGSDTEVWAKISLPSSEGLRGELPAAVPSGDVIQKADTRATGFPIRFPVDPRTGKRLPAQAALRVASGDFEIVAPGERAEIEIPPDTDSRTVIFTLEAKPGGRTSGRSRVFIDLIQDEKVIAQISVSTVLVERVTAAVPTWNLAALGYALPQDDLRRLPSAAEASTTLEDTKELTPLIESPPKPTQPQADYFDDDDHDIYHYDSYEESARRERRSAAPLLRIASAVAGLALVFVVALTVMQSGAPSPAALTASAQTSLINLTAAIVPLTAAATAISPTATAAALSDIGIAPPVNCGGSPGESLAKVLRGAGLDAELLDDGIVSQTDARAVSGYYVVAWGMCSGDTLTLTLELNETNSREGVSDPRSITIQWTPEALGQDDSIPVRLARAVTEYARGGADYTALAQTFDELAGAVAQPEARAALRALNGNSLFYAAQADAATPVNR